MTPAAIVTAIIAIFKSIPVIDGWFQTLMVAYIDGQTQATKSKIADAAALAARASTDEERYAASALWISALKRIRVS